MKKRNGKIIALLLSLVLLLTGCASTEGLKKVPGGQRPESLDMETLEPKFPSDSSLKNQMMGIAADVQTAKTIDEQREKYNDFLYNAFIYIVGPYNFTVYLADDGRSITTYYEQMINHMNTFISQYDASAWSAISQSSWGAQLKAEYDQLMCTPNSIRSTYPVADDGGKALVQSSYTARDALLEAQQNGFDGADKEALLDDLFSARQKLADNMGYASYLDFLIEKRDKLPYARQQLLALCEIVKAELAPALKNAESTFAPQLSAQEWNEKLPALVQRFDDFEEDLNYVLTNSAYTVEESGETRCFAYMLYQYDTSIGKALISGSEDDALTVLEGLGLEARNMALPQGEWSISSLDCYDQVQAHAFAGAALNELDAVYGENAPQARKALMREMAEEVCRAAMELELLDKLYENPVMAQSEREELVHTLAAEYGVAADEDLLVTNSDVVMGNIGAAGKLLGGLYGMQISVLGAENAGAARSVLKATLSVYNAGNPIAAGYAAGLTNPYSTDGVRALAAELK